MKPLVSVHYFEVVDDHQLQVLWKQVKDSNPLVYERMRRNLGIGSQGRG